MTRYYQNIMTGEVVAEHEYSYAATQKGSWELYTKIPRYSIETPPFSYGRIEFDEEGPLCRWEDVECVIAERDAAMEALRACERYMTEKGVSHEYPVMKNARKALEVKDG